MDKRVYKENGKKMDFNKDAFRQVLKKRAGEEGITIAKMQEILADKMHRSDSTIQGWYKRRNKPMDLETVKELATALGLVDTSLLLITLDGGNDDMEKLTDRQKNAAKRIYDICIWFLNEFYISDGFNAYWLKFKNDGSREPESDICDMVDGLMNKVQLVLDQEYFDLHDCDIYDELCEFVSEKLVNTYDGKLGYAYRFEAIADENPTTLEDYDEAMNCLNNIIEKYV